MKTEEYSLWRRKNILSNRQFVQFVQRAGAVDRISIVRQQKTDPPPVRARSFLQLQMAKRDEPTWKSSSFQVFPPQHQKSLFLRHNKTQTHNEGEIPSNWK